VSTLTFNGGLNLFKNFLKSLPKLNETIYKNDKLKQKQKELELEKMEFDIHEIIHKENNAILSGIVSSGKLRTNSKCFLGPDISGNFIKIEICDIHCKKVSVSYSFKGQYCSVCIKSLGKINTLTKENVKKGMYLLDTRITPVASRLFEIEVWTIDDTTRTLKNTYQTILNIKHVRQGVKIKNTDEIFLFLSDNKRINDLEKIIENDEINLSNIKNNINLVKKKKNNNKFDSNNNSSVIIIGPEDKKTKLIVEFLFNPEYISVGQKVIINDQILKAYGVITKIFK
jgi:GTPase